MPDGILGFDEAQSYLYLDGLVLTARIFWGPDPDMCREMIALDFTMELKQLASILDNDAVDATEIMTGYLRGYSDSRLLCENLESDYVRLFVSDKGGLCAPLYHSCYDSEEGLLMGRPYRLMHDKLQSAGLTLEGESSEPLDHLSVELEYLFVLLEGVLTLQKPELESEARAFASQEMLPWLTSFHNKVQGDAASDFYAGAAGLVVSLVRRAAR